MTTDRRIAALGLCAGIALTSLQPSPAADRKSRTSRFAYAYGSPQFTRFVADSYRRIPGGDAREFYRWMDESRRRHGARLAGTGAPDWSTWLRAKQRDLRRISHPGQRAREELAIAGSLHRAIKTTLPRFSLDRGFEFTNAVRRGERQCFLQAVLIAGLLQAMEVDAGVAMVYRNIQGATSNNGHAATLVKLSDGKDVIVDASDPEPFARQQGLFIVDARTGRYQYLGPVYEGPRPTILAYQTGGAQRKLAPHQVGGLDVAFLRSQFHYYRGERAPGGPLAPRATPGGLATAARYLRASVQECPANPLAVYMLGRVYLKQRQHGAARRQLDTARTLYASYGWVPPGVHDAFAQFQASAASSVPHPGRP
jgi:hypothetical protein